MVTVLNAVRDLARLREISSVLVRHGFGEIVARAGFGRTKKRDAHPQAAPDDDAPEIAPEEVAKGEEEKRRVSTYERARLRPRRSRAELHQARPDRERAGRRLAARAHRRAQEAPADDVPPRRSIRSARSSSRASAPRSPSSTRASTTNPSPPRASEQVHRAVLATEEGPKRDRRRQGAAAGRREHRDARSRAAPRDGRGDRADHPRRAHLLAGGSRAAKSDQSIGDGARLHDGGGECRTLRPELRGPGAGALPARLPERLEQARAHARVPAGQEARPRRRRRSERQVDRPPRDRGHHQDDLRGRLLPRRPSPRQRHHHAAGRRAGGRHDRPGDGRAPVARAPRADDRPHGRRRPQGHGRRGRRALRRRPADAPGGHARVPRRGVAPGREVPRKAAQGDRPVVAHPRPRDDRHQVRHRDPHGLQRSWARRWR